MSVSPILKASLLQDALYESYAVAGLGGRYCEGLAALTHGMTGHQLTMLGTLNEAWGQTCHNADASNCVSPPPPLSNFLLSVATS